MKIFSGSSNKPLAQLVAKRLGMELSPIEIFIFPDGERRIQIKENVVDQECIIVEPTNPPVDTHYMELFFIIDGLRRSGAKSVTAVVPYFGYQRQDHVFREGEAVSLEVIRTTLESTGLDKMIVFDLHSIKSPEIFTIPIVHLSALELFAQQINQDCVVEKCVLVSPDLGGIRRIKILSELLHDMPYATIVKKRNLDTGYVTAEDIEFHNTTPQQFETAIIVDDMISSGKTMIAAGQLLKEKGIKNVYVFATHPVFSEEAPGLMQQAEEIERVYVTDSIKVPKRKRFEKLHVISLAEMIAKELHS